MSKLYHIFETDEGETLRLSTASFKALTAAGNELFGQPETAMRAMGPIGPVEAFNMPIPADAPTMKFTRQALVVPPITEAEQQA